jgi:hypothetical protein
MSLSEQPLELYCSKDPRVDFQRTPRFGVADGARMSRWVPLTSQSVSPQGITFSFQPNNPSTALARDMKMKVSFTMEVTGLLGSDGKAFRLGVFDAPRRSPLAAVTGVIACQINDASVRLNTNWVSDVFLRANTSDVDLVRELSTAPIAADYFNSYADAFDPAVNPYNTVQGKNPLAATNNTSYGYEPRGSWQIDAINDPGGAPNAAIPAGTSITFSTTESLYVSPWGASTKYDDSLAFLGVQTMELNLTFANLQMIWSHCPRNATFLAPPPGTFYPSTFTGVTVTPNSAVLLQRFMSLSSIEKIPPVITYPYSAVNVFSTVGTAIPGFLSGGVAQGTITMASQTLAYIPRRMYIWVAPTARTVTTSDSYARIDSLQITWDNYNSYYGGATTEQLYLISRSNGLQESFTQWQQFTGSIFIAEFGKDLGIENEAESVSMATNKQLQVQVGFTSLSRDPNPANTIQYTAWMAFVSDGVLNIGGNSAIQRISVLTAEDVLRVKESGPVGPPNVSTDFFGGRTSFISGLKKGLHALEGFAKKTHIASQLAASAGHPEIASGLKALGYGRASKAALRRH